MANIHSIRTVPRKPVPFYETWTFLIFFCIVVPLLIRSFFYTPFHIPSGSMKSTLLVGDYIFVSKYAYGFSRYSFPLSPPLFEGRVSAKEPERGDVIVFRLPTDTDVDYIKRLIGLPGDKIQVVEGELYLNGGRVKREPIGDFADEERGGQRITRYIETLPNGRSYEILDEVQNGTLDNTPIYTVPPGHYFFMGDNRDNSTDSRVLKTVGYVPAENLVGRAEIIFLSVRDSLWKVWTWLETMRKDRFFTEIE